MGVPTSEVGYTSATARRGDHEISYKHVVALGKKTTVCVAQEDAAAKINSIEFYDNNSGS